MSSVENRQEELRLIRDRARRQAVETWEPPADVPADPLDQIAYWQERQELAERQVVEAVNAAKDAGAKWWEIGAVMGRTSDAARAFRKYHNERNASSADT